MNIENRYERGLAELREIDGEAGKRVLESLEGIATDFARYLIEFPFGDIYSRPHLDLKSKEIAVVAALNVGVSRAEVGKIIMQMAVYADFPAALNRLMVAKEVFAQGTM